MAAKAVMQADLADRADWGVAPEAEEVAPVLAATEGGVVARAAWVAEGATEEAQEESVG